MDFTPSAKPRRAYDPRTGGTFVLHVLTDGSCAIYFAKDGAHDLVTDIVEYERAYRIFKQRARAAANRKERDSVMRDLGLTKVRGNLGGTYWE